MNAMIPLSDIAHGRSGDKGNHANIAVIAYKPAGFAWLCGHLTAEVVAKYFAPLGDLNIDIANAKGDVIGTFAPQIKVIRYEAPNLLALNFVLYDVLAGGASRSLRIDTQGKTLGLALLQMRIDTPLQIEAMRR